MSARTYLVYHNTLVVLWGTRLQSGQFHRYKTTCYAARTLGHHYTTYCTRTVVWYDKKTKRPKKHGGTSMNTVYDEYSYVAAIFFVILTSGVYVRVQRELRVVMRSMQISRRSSSIRRSSSSGAGAIMIVLPSRAAPVLGSLSLCERCAQCFLRPGHRCRARVVSPDL